MGTTFSKDNTKDNTKYIETKYTELSECLLKNNSIPFLTLSDDEIIQKYLWPGHNQHVFEDFINDGQPIFRNAKIIENILYARNSIPFDNIDHKHRFDCIVNQVYINILKINFDEIAKVYGKTSLESINFWKPKFIEKFPECEYIFVELNRIAELQEWKWDHDW
jgi:hypothetical protein